MKHAKENLNLDVAAVEDKRHRLPAYIISGILMVSSLCYASYWITVAQHREITEDAYVEGNVVQITPDISGTVVAINADNTDQVDSEAVLIELNPVDAYLALERAKAQLAKTVRHVQGQYSASYQMQANIKLRQTELSRTQADLERRAPLVDTGAVSTEDFRHAEEAVKSARAALAAAEQQFAGNEALVDGIAIEQHPDVVMAITQVHDAYVATVRARLRAPVSGMVTKRNVQVGQRINPGTPLMSIVPLDQLWVTANFKESQLLNIRIGQQVKLTADVYGQSIEYRGHVVGIDAGTGNAFSLMPAQNASGNWIKVVQRVPVRIALDKKQLAANMLRIGLSMKVEVDTRERQAQPLAIIRTTEPQIVKTIIFDGELKGADEIVKRIIETNLSAKFVRGEKEKS